MIGLGISVVLLAGLIFLARNLQSRVNESNDGLSLISQKDRILKIIAEDLNRAVSIDGRSTDGTISFGPFSGARSLSRWPDSPRSSSNENDSLIIISEKFYGLSQPVQVTPTSLVYQPSGTSDFDEFIDQSFSQFNLFSLTRTNRRELVQKSSLLNANEIAIHDFNLILADLQNETLNLSPLEVIRYRIHGDQLIRETFNELSEIPNAIEPSSSAKIISDTASRFQVDFGFRSDDPNLKIPDFRISHPLSFRCQPSDINEDCCDPATETCPEFSDAYDLMIQMELFTETGKNQAPPAVAGFRIEDGKLFYTASKILIPAQLGIMSSETALTGTTSCNLNDIYSRCRADCDSLFTNPTRSSNNWMGYRSGSEYCRCGTGADQVFSPPEASQSHIPTWRRDGALRDKNQVEACLHSFHACSTPWLKQKHPGASLACSCIQTPSDEPVIEQDSSDGSFRFNLDPDNITAGPLNNIAVPTDEHNMKCSSYAVCDEKLVSFYGTSALGGSATPFADRCSCLTHNIDLNGKANSSQEVDGWARNWRKLCNVGVDTDDQPTCSNTLYRNSPSDPWSILLFDSEVNPQGLKQDDAMFCECLRQNETNNTNNQNYDFRQDNPPGLLAGTTERGNKPSFGSQTSESISDFQAFQPRDRDQDDNLEYLPTTISGGSCNANYCRNIYASWGGNLGCCTDTHPNANSSIQGITTNLQNSGIAGAEEYANYCTPQCSSSTQVQSSNGNRNEVTRVREIITGTASGGTLPSWCGGPASQGSSL